MIERFVGFDQSSRPPARRPRRRRSSRLRRARRSRHPQGACCALAQRRAARQCKRYFGQARRTRAGQRPLGRRQVDAVPGAGRYLALRLGHDHVPKNARLMILPQRPYFPSRLWRPRSPIRLSPEPMTRPRSRTDHRGRPARARPAHRGGSALEPDAVARRTAAAGHRARASATRLTYLFLDEATASLDEPAEAALYHLLEQRLPHAAIVSIGHRSTLAAFHRRRLRLRPRRRPLRRAGGGSRAGRVSETARADKKRRRLERSRRPSGTD